MMHMLRQLISYKYNGSFGSADDIFDSQNYNFTRTFFECLIHHDITNTILLISSSGEETRIDLNEIITNHLYKYYTSHLYKYYTSGDSIHNTYFSNTCGSVLDDIGKHTIEDAMKLISDAMEKERKKKEPQQEEKAFAKTLKYK